MTLRLVKKNGSVFTKPDIWWGRVLDGEEFLIVFYIQENGITGRIFYIGNSTRFDLELRDDEDFVGCLVYKAEYHSLVIYFWTSGYHENNK